MDSNINVKPFTCKNHSKEYVQGIWMDNNEDVSLKCILCAVAAAARAGKDSLLTVSSFVDLISETYSKVQEASKLQGKAPLNLCEILLTEKQLIDDVEKNIHTEKEKIEDSIEKLCEEFRKTCNNKKIKIFEFWDSELEQLKRNFIYFREKIEKYYESDNIDKYYPSKQDIIEKMNACENVDVLENIVKNLKHELNEGKEFLEIDKKVFGNIIKELNWKVSDQVGNLNKSINKTLITFDTVSKKIKIFLENLETENSDLPKYSENLTLKLRSGIDSKILNDDDVSIFQKWLPHKNPLKLNLLYRGSRDGFDSKSFHLKVDNYAPTLVVVKSNHKKVFGGYTDQTWNSVANYKTSTKSWLFSLTEQEKYPIKPNCISNAIYCESSFLPIFGYGHDLYIPSNCNVGNSCGTGFGYSYDAGKWANDEQKKKTILAGAHNFSTEEIEVFHVQTS